MDFLNILHHNFYARSSVGKDYVKLFLRRFLSENAESVREIKKDPYKQGVMRNGNRMPN